MITSGLLLVAGLAAIVVFVVFVELALRWWIARFAPIHIRYPNENFEITPDPTIFPGLSTPIRFTTNHFGARGGDVPTTGRTLKVLAVGGSGVECFLLDDRECWTEVAAERLRQPEVMHRLGVDQVRVWNVGKSGITPTELVHALPDLLDRIPTLDALVIMNGAAVWVNWCRLGLPSPYPVAQPDWDELAFHRHSARSWRPKQTAMAEVYRRLSVLRPPQLKHLRGIGKAIQRARLARANAVQTIDICPEPESWLDHYRSTLGKVVDQALPKCGRVILMHQPFYAKSKPTQTELDTFWHGAMGVADTPTDFASHRLLGELNDLIGQATREVALAKGLLFIDPSSRVAPVPENFYDHIHFMPTGAQRVGEYVGDQLAASLAPAAELQSNLPRAHIVTAWSARPTHRPQRSGNSRPSTNS